MNEDFETTLNETLESLDAAVRPVRPYKDRTFIDATFLEDVTAPVPIGFSSQAQLDQSSAVLLAQDDPGVKAFQILFSEFINIYVSHSSDAQIWDEILAYEEACTKQVDTLSKLIRKVPRHHSSFSKTQEMVLKMIAERNTWRLLRSLYRERQKEESHCEESFVVDVAKSRSDEAIVTHLYESNSSVREAQNVVDWLEINAKDDYEGWRYSTVNYFGETHVAWENTLRMKKNGDETRQSINDDAVNPSIGRKIVTSLDPDSTTRQKKNLHELDEEEDERLLRSLFACLRSGQLTEAQDLCAKSGQHWRAATLEGWKLFHDPNESDKHERAPVKGNRYRDVWKSTAWTAASDSRLSADERAMYGAMCGHLPAMLLVCRKWEDQIWAHFRTLIDQYVEETLRTSSVCLRSFQPLPKDYPEEKLTPDGIFKRVESRVGSSNVTFYHHLQKYLILNDIEGLLTMSHQMLLQTGLISHSLRCLTHLVLILKRLGAVPFELEEAVTDIVHSCAKEAIERGDIEQVAQYSAVLPDTLQTRLYADFLVNIHEEHHRKHALKVASSVGLNIKAITATVVAKIRLAGWLESSTELAGEASAADRGKIEAIDWLLFDQVQRPEALRQANAILRAFLISNKISAAKTLMKKIPSDSVDVIVKLHQSREGTTADLPPYYDNRIREYLCFKAFLDAQESFTDWFNHYHQKKPSAPATLPSTASFQQQLAQEHLLQQFNQELDKWKQTLNLITKKASERLFNVLLFPDGGWMVDVASAPPPLSSSDDSIWSPTKEETTGDIGPEDKMLFEYLGLELRRREPNRAHQMTTLRSIYIPQVTSLLQTVLHSTEKYKEVLQLADLIASEQYTLYKCFSSGEMQRFLCKLQDTCRHLLDNGMDAFGYSK